MRLSQEEACFWGELRSTRRGVRSPVVTLQRHFGDRLAPIALPGQAAKAAQLHHVGGACRQSFEEDVLRVLEGHDWPELTSDRLDPALDRFRATSLPFSKSL